MKVMVNGVQRQFPMGHIKIRWKPRGNNYASVRVDYPSYSIKGEISLENMNKLIEFGERIGRKVWTGEDDFAQMIEYIQDLKYGEPKETDDEVMRYLREKLRAKP